MIDWSQLKTAELAKKAQIEDVWSQRKSAYILESDGLKMEADYDAISSDSQPDYSAWLAKVSEIKLRFPLP